MSAAGGSNAHRAVAHSGRWALKDRMSAFDPEQFARTSTHVARLARADDLFGLLRRRIVTPHGCAALVWRTDSGPVLFASGAEVPADGVREIMLIRTAPLELAYSFERLASKDGFEFAAAIQCQVHIVPQREDLASFRTSVLGSRDSANPEHVRLLCAETVHAAAAQFARERDAARLADPTEWDAFDAALAERFKPLGFSTGLALGRDPRSRWTSETFGASQRVRQTARLRQERLEEDARLRAASVEARKLRLSELETLVAKARQVAEQAGGAGVADLVKAFDPAQRGEFYQGLLAANRPARPTSAIVAIAGEEVFFFDPAHNRHPSKRVALAGPLGGLRSAQIVTVGDHDEVIIGAGRGLHRITPDGNVIGSLTVTTDTKSRGGFNAVALCGDSIYATHSELGIWRWPHSSGGPGEACLAESTGGAKTVRGIQTDLQNRLWVGIDDSVLAWRPEATSPPTRWKFPGNVTALLVAENALFIALADGRVLHRPHLDDDTQERIFGPGGTIDSLAWSPGGGMPRLIVANGAPQVHMLVIGDASRTEYRGPTGIRSIAATEDHIAGITHARDQVVLWRAETPEEPAAMIPVSRICGRSIQDVLLLT